MIRALLARLFGRPSPDAAAEIDRLQAEIKALRRLGEGKAANGREAKPSRAGAARAGKAAAAQDTRWRQGESGRQALFTYVDVDGVVTDRSVTNWLSDGAYIKAVCNSRHATRTFRKDRIEGWRARV